MDRPISLPRMDDGTLMHYAWPGGYPLFYLTADSGTLCPDCARDAEEEGLTQDPDDPQWYIIAADVPWEESLTCDHCYADIEPAYPSEEGE